METSRFLVQDTNINVFSMQKDIYCHSQALRKEFDNQFNKFAIKLLNGKEMVGHFNTTRILESSIVFSHSWWIDFCRSEPPSLTM